MLEPGVVVNERYRVVRMLGEGGMGAVFEAEHTSVGRKVALKMLHPEYAKMTDLVERFQREAKASSAVGHDNIIDVIDFGFFRDAPYLVMELLKGGSLRDRLETDKGTLVLPVGGAVYVLRQVLAALGAAHAAGIVHRDLKPDNVFLVSKGGTRDFVKLLDFGISKFKKEGDGEGGGGKSLTKTGALMGTPNYMAPEQALAKREIDHRADIYAAGVLLYQMVTGVLPFDAESQAEILLAIAYRPKPLPLPSSHNAKVPAELDAAIMRALEKEPAKRFQSTREFSDALAKFEAEPEAGTDRLSGVLRPYDGPKVIVDPDPEERPAASTLVSGSAAGAAVAGSIRPTAPVTNESSDELASEVSIVRPRESRGLVYAVVALAVVAVGALGAVAMRASGPSAASAGPSVSAVAVASASPSVRVELEGLPSGAEVTLDGARVEGASLQLARGASGTVRVSAPGRLPFETRVTGDRDRTIAVALAEEPPAAPSASAAPVVVASAPVAPVERPAVRPAGQTSEGANQRARRPEHAVASAPAQSAHAAPSAASHGAARPGPVLQVSTEF